GTHLADDLRQMISLLKRPAILVFALSAFLYVMTEQGIMSWLPTFNERVLHLSEAMAVRMAVLLTLAFAAGRYVTSFLVKKINWLTLLVICLVSAGLLITFLLSRIQNLEVREVNTLADVPLIAYLFPLTGFFLAPVYPVVNAVVLHT